MAGNVTGNGHYTRLRFARSNLQHVAAARWVAVGGAERNGTLNQAELGRRCRSFLWLNFKL